MKVVTIYSPSHKEMLEQFFLPSFPVDERLELKINEVPQLAGDLPQFNSPEWSSFMKIKAKVLWDELETIPENTHYLFLDTDIIIVNNFYDYLEREMQNWDLICQSDSPFPHFPNYCTGVLCVKNNEITRNLMKAVSLIMDGNVLVNNQPKFKNEQEIITWLIVNKNVIFELQKLKAKTFPFDIAFTYGSFVGKVWDGSDINFSLPSKEKLLWVHANYAHHEHKIPLLQLFKNKLNAV